MPVKYRFASADIFSESQKNRVDFVGFSLQNRQTAGKSLTVTQHWTRGQRVEYQATTYAYDDKA
jgi:hypothetical protein